MQCKALRDSAREIQNFDVAYFMASVDTLEDNTAFAAEHEANFPILADPSKEMVDAYGALMGVGFANRWTYYISCLLYTSPSPRDRQKSRMPSSA